MGHFFEYDTENSLLRCSRRGSVTDALMYEVYSTAQELLWSRPRCRAIDDFSEATDIDVSSDVVKRLADMPAFSSLEMLVIVAPQNHVYGLSRMYSMLGEQSQRNVHVVRTMEEAYSLLGVSSPHFIRIRESS